MSADDPILLPPAAPSSPASDRTISDEQARHLKAAAQRFMDDIAIRLRTQTMPAHDFARLEDLQRINGTVVALSDELLAARARLSDAESAVTDARFTLRNLLHAAPPPIAGRNDYASARDAARALLTAAPAKVSNV